jgi:hypothetical protein
MIGQKDALCLESENMCLLHDLVEVIPFFFNYCRLCCKLKGKQQKLQKENMLNLNGEMKN